MHNLTKKAHDESESPFKTQLTWKLSKFYLLTSLSSRQRRSSRIHKSQLHKKNPTPKEFRLVMRSKPHIPFFQPIAIAPAIKAPQCCDQMSVHGSTREKRERGYSSNAQIACRMGVIIGTAKKSPWYRSVFVGFVDDVCDRLETVDEEMAEDGVWDWSACTEGL